MGAQLYSPFLGQTPENQLERLNAQHFGLPGYLFKCLCSELQVLCKSLSTKAEG